MLIGADLSGITKPELPAVIIPGRFDPAEGARASAEDAEMSESTGEVSPGSSTAGSPSMSSAGSPEGDLLFESLSMVPLPEHL